MVPVISFVGRSNCGKTTYLEKLIAEMKRRGYRVATIKHDVHGFDMDKPGKDTWRHARAGADVVCIASPQKIAMIKRVDQEYRLEGVAALISDVDVIFTEGYKREGKQRIEVFRREVCPEPLCAPHEIVAMVTDTVVHDDLPSFPLDDAGPLADFIAVRYLSAER